MNVTKNERNYERYSERLSAESSVQNSFRVAAAKGKVKFSHTRYQALGPELIPVYRQSARR